MVPNGNDVCHTGSKRYSSPDWPAVVLTKKESDFLFDSIVGALTAYCNPVSIMIGLGPIHANRDTNSMRIEVINGFFVQ